MAKSVKSVTVTTVPATENTKLSALRVALAEAEGTGYGARVEYAEYMVSEFGPHFWDKSQNAAGFARWDVERTAFGEALKARNPKANVSQATKRLRDVAVEIVEGVRESGPRVRKGLKDYYAEHMSEAFLRGRRSQKRDGFDGVENEVHNKIVAILQALKVNITELEKKLK